MKKYKVHFLFVFSLIIALSEFILAIKMDVLISTLSSGKNEKTRRAKKPRTFLSFGTLF